MPVAPGLCVPTVTVAGVVNGSVAVLTELAADAPAFMLIATPIWHLLDVLEVQYPVILT
jgi:hypothetical protein